MTVAVAKVIRPNKPNLDMTLAVAEVRQRKQARPHCKLRQIQGKACLKWKLINTAFWQDSKPNDES